MRLLRRSPERSERGQVLVMVAASFTVLLGFSALVTDLGMLWTIQQSNRSIADSAVLAGAQEMQLVGLRGINAGARAEARAAAVTNIKDRVGATGMPTCAVGGAPTDTDSDGKLGYDTDVRNCPMPGTDYLVSALAPSLLCVQCELERSMMVEVTRNEIPMFFAGLFGFDEFTARQTSVATITYSADFAVLTLRPPVVGSSTNAGDVSVSGSGTRLTISVGDIGTNTNMVLSGGATVLLDEGYKVHHYDAAPAWVPPPPPNKLASFIQDPNHTYPTRTGAPTFSNDGQAATTAAECAAARAAVPSTYRAPFPSGPAINDPAMTYPVRCVKPGIYNYGLRSNNGEVLILTPGVYFLDSGLVVRGILIGGYEPALPGVALVFNRTVAGRLDANNAEIFALNGGSRFNNCTPGCSGFEAAPATGFDGDGIDTCGGGCPIGESNLSVTMLVEKDANCVVTQPYPTSCNDNGNNTLNMAGGGALYLAGVQYAPTDNVKISGGSSGDGKAGRIISWTVSYSGGTKITQTYPGVSEGPGTIRLDAACTGAGTNSMTNAACNP